MWFVYALCDVLGLTLGEFTVWFCALLVLQALGLLIWGLLEIRRPTLPDEVLSRRHFGGV